MKAEPEKPAWDLDLSELQGEILEPDFIDECDHVWVRGWVFDHCAKCHMTV
jgi:hypothetical protein